MLKRILFFVLLITNIAFSQNELPLIPQPKSIQISKGNFVLNAETVIQAEANTFEAQFLKQSILELTGLELKIVAVSNTISKINLSWAINNEYSTNNESYALRISKSTVAITSDTNKGLFYGIQTLLQLLPVAKSSELKLPCLTIQDEPKYTWRGMHLDCARHFFPKEFVKKYIDYLAMYKMNTFHWHFTDDQGWRIEIKKYPKLTSVGAWRKGSMIGHYNDQLYDDKPYGGFYTQEDIQEIITYASNRHITIIPEIEMPGHALAALSAYPEYSCTGGPFEVAKQWGVLDDVFCPKVETITFLEDILSEVIALFPSQYIHIGGDECPKTRWKNCSHCQALIQEKGLKDEHELQSYFIQRIEKFVNSKGKKIIGWDEILEGGLAPNAAVMSWRGTEGGIAAAKQKHFVVMTPGSHCYFDHYQGDPKNEPLAIGGYTTLEKVYQFNPIPNELSVEESKYILGAQGNVWSEYMYTPDNVVYMIFPRIMALSEVLWGTSKPEHYKNFEYRVIGQFPVLEKKGINYSKAIFEVVSKTKPSESGKGVFFELHSATDINGIRYTTDGTIPNWHSIAYTKPIEVLKDQTVKAAYFEKGTQKSGITEQSFHVSKATGKKITLRNQPHENYNTGGAFALIDGIMGNKSKFGSDCLGFWGTDFEGIIDFGTTEHVSTIQFNLFQSESNWIYLPKKIEVFVADTTNQYQAVAALDYEDIKGTKGIININSIHYNTQFLKIKITNFGKIPSGMPGAGSNAWLFIDEIIVE